jgi:hypothetical protein
MKSAPLAGILKETKGTKGTGCFRLGKEKVEKRKGECLFPWSPPESKPIPCLQLSLANLISDCLKDCEPS